MPNLLTRSAKSLQMLRSHANYDTSDSLYREASNLPIYTTVFEDLLPNVVKKLSCTYDIFVKKSLVKDPFSSNNAVTKSTPTSKSSAKPTHTPKRISHDLESVVVVAALYDDDEELVEIQLFKHQKIPLQLLQAIAIVAPHYEMLRKITIRECKMDVYTTFELSRITTLIPLTEICLDGSFAPKDDYAILLETPSCLKHLSLSSCRINDSVCLSIVSKMQYGTVAEKQMLTLHLSRNLITDKGAEFISTMLRSNRHLRYLNLSGNQLTDDGASLILDVLRDFRLRPDENAAKQQSIMKHAKRRNKLILKFYADRKLELADSQKPKDNTNVKFDNINPNDKEALLKQADALATQLIGQNQDPFGLDKTALKDGWAYCKGNFTLCYLNLAFNNLTYFSVGKVLDLLIYQQGTDKLMEPGLQKIILEGNYMPVFCPEYTQISEMMNKTLLTHNDGFITKKIPRRPTKNTSSLKLSSKLVLN